MPICKKCGKSFSIRVKIDNKYRNLQRRKYCFSCSPFNKHNTFQLHLMKGVCCRGKNERLLICQKCGREYIFDSNNKKGHTLSKCNSCCVNERKTKVKDMAIEYKGGKCSICNYNRCNSALEFHHVDSSSKEFSLSGCHCFSWERIKIELDKCICVCSNCHREIHNSLIPEELIVSMYNKLYSRPLFDEELKEIKKKKICPICNKEFYKNTVYCSAKCASINARKLKIRPSKEQLLDEIAETNYCAVGRKYGVTDNTIRKWLKK